MARPSHSRFRVQHISRTPRGWRVRTKREGAHELRIAFPPGARRTGSGQLVEILHPIAERNPDCALAGKNPAELVIFGNPSNPITDREIEIAHEKYLREISKEKDPKRHLSAATIRAWNRYIDLVESKRIAEAQQENPTWMNVNGVIGKLVDERGDSPLTLEYQLEKKDGTKVWVKPRYGPRTAVKSTKKNASGNNHRTGCDCPICRNMRASNRRKNQGGESERGDDMQQSVSLYQTFHGKDPSGVIERQVSAEIRLDYASLGDLDYLIVKPEGVAEVKINFSGDGVKLASAPDGRQLYLIGGKQMLNEECLGKFTDDTSKDLFDLGEAREVQYIAKKAPNFDTVRYYHKFGEERSGSEMPRAFYDAIRRQIFLAGGEYHIEAPGIIN